MSEQTSEGTTKAAGEGLTDEEMVEQVQDQTPAEEKWADVSKREADGATTETELAKASADELAGE